MFQKTALLDDRSRALHHGLAAAFVAMMALGLLVTGCAKSTSTPSQEPSASVAFDEGSAEHELRSLIEELTIIVSANSAEPEVAVAQVQAFARSNKEALARTADGLERNYAALNDAERREYAQDLNDYLQDVNARWHAQLEQLKRRDEQAAQRIESTMRGILR